MLSAVTEIGIFFKYSPKRQEYLTSIIKEYNENASSPVHVTKGKLLCETRWVKRHTSSFEFHIPLKPVILCLSKIVDRTDKKKNWDPITVSEANGFLCRMSTSSFVAAFQTAKFLFGYTTSLPTNLQGTYQNVISAYECILSTLEVFTHIRENAEVKSKRLYETNIIDMAKTLDIELKLHSAVFYRHRGTTCQDPIQ